MASVRIEKLCKTFDEKTNVSRLTPYLCPQSEARRISIELLSRRVYVEKQWI